jgi:hypothetical protein
MVPSAVKSDDLRGLETSRSPSRVEMKAAIFALAVFGGADALVMMPRVATPTRHAVTCSPRSTEPEML